MTEKEEQTFEGFVVLEEWRPVTGCEGIYEVSSEGAVRRVGKAARNGKGRGGGARIGRILCLRSVWNGYLVAQMWVNGQPRGELVHRIVAKAFIGPIPDGREVNHKDGNKRNNRLQNLEYVTRSENNRHAYRTGLHPVRIDQLVAARRKPRIMISCGCGCGVKLETPDRGGRDRRFISGHNMRKAAS